MCTGSRELQKIAGEWANKADIQWKQRTTKGREAKEEMEREVEPRVKLLRFQGEPIAIGLYFQTANILMKRIFFRCHAAVSAGLTTCSHISR